MRYQLPHQHLHMNDEGCEYSQVPKFITQLKKKGEVDPVSWTDEAEVKELYSVLLTSKKIGTQKISKKRRNHLTMKNVFLGKVPDMATLEQHGYLVFFDAD